MNDFSPEVPRRVKEQIEHELFEIEERLERENAYHDELTFKLQLAQQLYADSNHPEEIDLWEFELQIIEAQKRQSHQEIDFLMDDLRKQRKFLSALLKQGLS